MKYKVIPPPSHLAPFVRFFWMMEKELSAGEKFVYRTMADGCAEMIFHYQSVFEEILPTKKNKQAHSLIHGQTRNFKRFETRESFGIFGVYLLPTALPYFFAIPSFELSDLMPDLGSILGAPGMELEEKMMMAIDTAERVKIITAFLEGRLIPASQIMPEINGSINYVFSCKGRVEVSALANYCCLSIRQFERKFKSISGFSPKLYCRIVRFQNALNEYGNKDKSLTEIAYDCGYYDQSHFIHDFKTFSGYTPRVYFSGLAEGNEFREV